ncbi:MAG: hypothetical protein PUC31_00855 [Bacteroidales bacterium]|nr:hypothetical protein [Bacteroidales bacterium]
MEILFCNECNLSKQIPNFIAEELLGVENLSLLQERYHQMKDGYNLTYLEWRDVFTDKLKPFREEWDDTTAVTIPIKHKLFKQDFERIGKGSIGLDLPTWFNIKKDNPRIMLIFQDPLRGKCYQECKDAVLSSPFGLQDATHRSRANGGKMANELVRRLTNNGYGVYLTDARKYFIGDHQTSDAYSLVFTKTYTDILAKEISIVKPNLCVCFGDRANCIMNEVSSEYPELLITSIKLPHLSGTARGAIKNQFKILDKIGGATADNIAEVYAKEIIFHIELLK